MRKDKSKRHEECVDESEVWKRKSLTSAENRRKFAKAMNIIMVVAAALVVAACVYAYCFDK